MILRIVTPRTAEFSVEVGKVFLPGVRGKLEVMNNHAPLIVALGAGEVVWSADDASASGSMAVSGGVAEVKDNVITVAAQQ